jgi:hypothetical protein
MAITLKIPNFAAWQLIRIHMIMMTTIMTTLTIIRTGILTVSAIIITIIHQK